MVAINVSERKRRAKPPSPLVLILNFQGFRYYLRAMRKSVLLLFLLSGCTSIEGANERGGTISHVIGLTTQEAFKKADAHCHKYGRVAQISGTDTLASTMTFNCVAP
jgi:hypothetical protein